MDIQLFMIYLKICPSGHGLFLSGQHPLSLLQVLTSHLSLETIRPILSSCVLIKGWFNPSPRVGNDSGLTYQPGCQVWLRDWQYRAIRFRSGNFAVNFAIKKETLSTRAAQLMDKPGASNGALRSRKHNLPEDETNSDERRAPRWQEIHFCCYCFRPGSSQASAYTVIRTN